ncbi:MAG: ABC transporter permease [Phycisphaerales bacterium]
MSDDGRSSESSARGWRTLIWPLVALALLLIFNAIRNPGFFRVEIINGQLYGSVIDIVDQAAPILIVSLGMTLVIATAGVDLSVGAVMAIAGATAAIAVTREQGGLVFALVAALGAGVLAGFWNGTLVALCRIQPIVATLILMVAGRGIAQLLTDGQIVTFTDPGLAFLGGGHAFGVPAPALIAVAMLGVVAGLVRLTALGLFIESVGDNETASRLAGIPVASVKVFAYTLTGLLAGVAGLIEAGDIRAADANTTGLYLELDAILAVVIGGTPLTGGRMRLIGTVLGALIIQTLTTTILTTGVDARWTLVVKALVVLAVCLLQSERARDLLRRRRANGGAPS